MRSDKDFLAALISHAGVRQHPSEEIESAVRTAAYQAWQQALHEERRRRIVWFSSAAAVIVAVIGGYLGIHMNTRSTTVVATFVRHSGQEDGSSRPASKVYLNEEIDTGAGVALLSLEGTANVRLASHTRLHWRKAGEIVLASGKIYVDSGKQPTSLLIDTPLGSVTHIGTRYQVASAVNDLDVGVRDGVVKVITTRGDLQLKSREAMSIDAHGVVKRRDIESSGAQWEWADNLAPRFDFNNRTLAEFLEWVAHETGHTLKYNDRQTALTASQTFLHVQGLPESATPMTALSMVLPTTDCVVHFDNDQMIASPH